MDRGDVTLLAQLSASLNEAVQRLAKLYGAGDAEGVEQTKKEILAIQQKIEASL